MTYDCDKDGEWGKCLGKILRSAYDLLSGAQ